MNLRQMKARLDELDGLIEDRLKQERDWQDLIRDSEARRSTLAAEYRDLAKQYRETRAAKPTPKGLELMTMLYQRKGHIRLADGYRDYSRLIYPREHRSNVVETVNEKTVQRLIDGGYLVHQFMENRLYRGWVLSDKAIAYLTNTPEGLNEPAK